jgi:hypothetical protein
MKDIISNYWYLIVAIPIAVFVSIPYWKALKLSRAQKSKHPFPRSVLVASAIGFILAVILGFIVLKDAVVDWEYRLFQLISPLFFFGTLLGLVVALKAGVQFKVFEQVKPKDLALPVEASWALTALAFVWGAIGGILGSMILIVVA